MFLSKTCLSLKSLYYYTSITKAMREKPFCKKHWRWFNTNCFIFGGKKCWRLKEEEMKAYSKFQPQHTTARATPVFRAWEQCCLSFEVCRSLLYDGSPTRVYAGSPRSSLAQAQLRDCTAAESWPLWCWEEQSHPSSCFLGIACWEQPAAVLLSVQPPTWLFLTWISISIPFMWPHSLASRNGLWSYRVNPSIFSESRLPACCLSLCALCRSTPCMDNVPRSVPGTHFFTCAGSLSCSNEEGFSHFCGAWVQAYTAQHSVCRPGITEKLFYLTVHALLVRSASRVRYFPFHEKIMLSIMKFHSVSSCSPQACSTQDKKEFLLVNNEDYRTMGIEL